MKQIKLTRLRFRKKNLLARSSRMKNALNLTAAAVVVEEGPEEMKYVLHEMSQGRHL